MWRQIAADLAARIAHQPPGTRLPTEAALASEFGVNRHTIRHAIEHLTRTGAVRTEQGRGSFVAEQRLSYEVRPRTRFTEWIRQHDREPGGDILELLRLPAPPPIAQALHVAEGATITMLYRLGRADGVPISLARHYFAQPGILDALRAAPTISAALAAVGVPDFRRDVTSVTARLPRAAEARLLQTPRSQPVLVCENLNVDPSGAPVEYGLSLYPSSRVQIVLRP